MKTRILAGIVMVLVTVAILVLGELTLGLSMVVISLIAVYEGSKAIGVTENDKALFGINVLYCLGINAVNVLNVTGVTNTVFAEIALPVSIAFIIVSLIYAVIRFGDTRFSLVAENIFFTIYIVIFFSYIVLIRESKGGEALIWLVLLSPWATDTLAYFSGVFLGKHKLIEKVSPKKTIEGSIGGVIGCIIVALIYGCVIKKIGYMPNFINLVIFAGVSSVISQFGDLAASCIKREHNVKDYGNLIPGHGGILDRFDSVLFTAPVLFYFMQYLPIV